MAVTTAATAIAAAHFAPSTAAAGSTATRPLGHWPRLVHYNVATHELASVARLDGELRLLVVNIDETEPPCLTETEDYQRKV